MKSLLMSLALSVSIASAAVLTEPCIPDGGILNIEFEADLSAPGIPPGAQIVPGSGEGMEADIGADDELGSATEVVTGRGTTFSVPITNHDGILSGPNGVAQNGGSEGDCIEVYVTYQIRYIVEVCDEGPGPADGGEPSGTGECWEEWRVEEVEISPPKEVCPC